MLSPPARRHPYWAAAGVGLVVLLALVLAGILAGVLPAGDLGRLNLWFA